MTPQEKAKELVDKFVNIESLKDFGGMDIALAKECAVICCDEIIGVLDICGWTGYAEYPVIPEEFWQEVKQEIEKL